MHNTYYNSTHIGERNRYNDFKETYETATYKESATEDVPTDKTEFCPDMSANNNVCYNTSHSVRGNLKNNVENYMMQEQGGNDKMVHNAVYETATSDDVYVGNDGCNYLREKTNSLISGKWVPKKPKVFVRRIDGSARPPKETTYRVVNGNYNTKGKPMPYDSNARDAFVKQKMEEFENMPCEYIGASTKRIISPEECEAVLRSANNNREVLNDFCVVNNYQTYNNVPLCVQESNQTNDMHNAPEFPIRPLIQDEYYFRYIMNSARSQGCSLTPENILKVVKLILKFFYKTVTLVIQKIRAELDTTAFSVVLPVNSLPNMDMACGVCERTEEQRIAEANRQKKCFSHFEGMEKHTSIMKRILNIFDAYDKSENETPQMRIREYKEPRACYQEEAFPKDKNGKVILPEFESNDN